MNVSQDSIGPIVKDYFAPLVHLTDEEAEEIGLQAEEHATKASRVGEVKAFAAAIFMRAEKLRRFRLAKAKENGPVDGQGTQE